MPGRTAPLVVILVTGSLGDVAPALNLAVRLRDRGFRLRIGAPANFEEMVTRRGIDFARTGDDIRLLLKDPVARTIIERGAFANLKGQLRVARTWHETTARMAVAACEGADLVVFHPKVTFASSIAEALGVPSAMLAYQPLTPTGDFPIFPISTRSFGRTLNRASYAMLGAEHLFLGGITRRLRRELLGLPSARSHASLRSRPDGSPLPIIYAFSEAVQPRPADWPAHVHVTGYVWDTAPASTEWQPDARLARFLAAGPPPVYIGFGSMPLGEPGKALDLWLSALAANGLRAIIAGGWGGLDEAASGRALPENVHVITGAPHDRLFPLVAAVVHHGGAGTTAMGLRCGRPTLVCPFLIDQPYWAARVEALGAGIAGPSPGKWTGERLTADLRRLVGNPDFARAAGTVAAQLAAEDGARRACDILEGLLAGPAS